MALTINTNLNSMLAQRNSSRTQNDLSTSIARLSSGLRINSAKDDAAGMAISERMTSQIRGLNQAARNSNDAISLAQTAEGALGSVSNNLQRMRELAVQSANASNSASDRAALQGEVSQLMSEIGRVAGQTDYNGIKLLDGSFNSQAFQVGAGANQTISIKSITDARTTSLGSNTYSANGSLMGKTLAADTAANIATNGNGIAAESTLTLATNAGTTGAIAWNAKDDAKAIAAAINTSAANVGVTATATNAAVISNVSTTGVTTLSLGGQTITANITDKTDLTSLANAINGATSSTGISANFRSSTSKDSLVLTTSDGRDINISSFTNGTATMDVQTYDATNNTTGTAVTITSGGNDSTIVTGNVKLDSSKGSISWANATNTDVFNSASGIGTFTSLSTMDISNVAGAQSALSVIDSALSQINSGRADLGAIQNRFSSTIENLQTSSENQAAARGRIQDADFAAETANM
ncbi:MAG TPA: flagellin, partial [Burkholderiaceae bacterium]|nr:flagellin [Burkholderiaceae bacterium]